MPANTITYDNDTYNQSDKSTRTPYRDMHFRQSQFGTVFQIEEWVIADIKPEIELK